MKSILILFAMLLFGLNLNAIELRYKMYELQETGRYETDYLFIGNTLDFKGESKDLFAFGEIVDFSGKTRLALTGAGRKIDVSGTVGNGVKVAGQTISMKGKTTGTSFLAASTVTFEQESQTDGDTLIGGRKVTIKGKIIGDVYIGAGEVSIQNEIQGNVKIYAGQLTIPEQGKINGNLVYYSEHELSKEDASRVTGKIEFEKTEGDSFSGRFDDDFLAESGWLLFFFKVSVILCGLLILLFPAARSLEKKLTHNEVLSHSLWGLIPIFVYPTAIVISIGLVVTIPLGISLLLAFFPVVLVSKILGLTMIGSFIAGKLNIRSNSRYIFFLIAAVLYTALSYIPIFGFLLLIFVTSVGCGLMVFSLFNKKLA
ncbi:polymer-forming cytoskeletal protein [bacterium]|nr:polymer-forming cytoskeletal protein [bacterium]